MVLRVPVYEIFVKKLYKSRKKNKKEWVKRKG